jgi:uncharacterized protein (TIGR03437 family)
MTRKNGILLAKFAAMLAVPVIIYAYAEGPGGGGPGNVKVTFPKDQTYTPGTAQHLVVTVADPNQRRWGFQLTARHSSDTTAQAGTFTPGSDGYTQIVCTQTTFQTESFGSCDSSMPLQYIEHTWNGTRPGQTQSASFAFDWMPPSSNVGNIVIYVAGNAANGDGSSSGDYIYLAKYTLTPAQAQSNTPTISTSNGVVNAASYQPTISAGSWVTINGTTLANSTRTWLPSEIVNGKLPTSLDGVSVEIDGKPAYVQYISPTQINVQSPSDTATGLLTVQVTNNGAASNSMNAQMHSASPAFFLWAGKYAVATTPSYGYVGPPNLFSGVTTTPAKPGDIIILWGTGFGPTKPPVAAGVVPSTVIPSGQTASLVNSVNVLIGNVSAKVIGAALSPDNAGLYQIAVEVPAGTPSGDQPVVAGVLGLQSPSGVYINVQP